MTTLMGHLLGYWVGATDPRLEICVSGKLCFLFFVISTPAFGIQKHAFQKSWFYPEVRSCP